MNFIQVFFDSLNRKERILLVSLICVFFITFVTRSVLAVQDNSQFVPVEGGEYTEGSLGQPNLINPVISDNSIDKDISSLVYSSVSDVATSVVASDNNLVYTLTIKDNIVWSDGESLDVDDIIFTIDAIQNPEVNSPLNSKWRGIATDKISDLKLRLSLPSSYAFFEKTLNDLTILPEHAFGSVPPSNLRLSSYNLEPISSGPYEFEDFQRRRDGFITEYTLTASDSYHKGELFIKKFTFKFFEDRDSLYRSYQRRNIDGFGVLTPPDQNVYNMSNVNIKEFQMPRYYGIFFNPRATSNLESENFRRALDQALDKEALVEEVLSSRGSVVTGPYGPEMMDADYSGPDKEAASSTLWEVRESLPEDESLTIDITVPDIDFIVATANFVKEQWESVGVEEVSVNALTPEEFSSSVLRERDYESIIFGNIMENRKDLYPFWHSSERFYPGLNLSLYSNEQVDSLLEDIRQAGSKEEIDSKFGQAVDLIVEDTPTSFLFSLPYIYIHNDKLDGLESQDINFVVPNDRFKEVENWHVRKARVIK